MQYQINSIPETISLAKKLKNLVKIGDTITLSGSVGSGKSTLVKYFLNEYEIEYSGSPTFGLINYYTSNKGEKIIHADLYREPDSILHELIENDESICIIEWCNTNLMRYIKPTIELNIIFDGASRVCIGKME